VPASPWARRRKIQLPYPNTYETIWEYKESFVSRQIDFLAILGSICPVCGKQDCCRQITPYWRYAIDLFPEFRKEPIPVARFLCRKKKLTFSLLPTQLAPYHYYTVNAVVGALLVGIQFRQMGQKGFHGASIRVDQESLVTPWLIACWLAVAVIGFRRAHPFLREIYDLSDISTLNRNGAWEEVGGYFLCFGWGPKIRCGPLVQALVNRYSRSTRLFLFGTPSQNRKIVHP
jgi:hypothetical protein